LGVGWVWGVGAGNVPQNLNLTCSSGPNLPLTLTTALNPNSNPDLNHNCNPNYHELIEIVNQCKLN